MKDYMKLISVFGLSMLFVGCGKVTEDDIKTKYIGDNTKVSQIASRLPYPTGVTYDAIEIQSAEEPYELKVILKTDNTQLLDLQECADEAFKKIGNMGIISFYNRSGRGYIITYVRGQS